MQLVDKSKLTVDGKDWLTTALDPFHDYNHQIAGYPDADVSQTVVSCYQYEASITAPPSVVGAALWDVHIFNTPLTQSHTAKVVNEEAAWSYLQMNGPDAANSMGALHMYATPAGGALCPAAPTNVNAVNTTLPAQGVEDVAAGCSRVIAMGYEVHNTTAEMYKQGSVTSYRMPQTHGLNSEFFCNNAQTQFSKLVGNRYRHPPISVAQANLLKGTRTWEAKDGVYATCLQSTVQNPLKQLAPQQLVLSRDSDPGATGAPWIVEPLQVTLNATTQYREQPLNLTVFDTTGAIFTGLSASTTLTVKVRFYVERAPTWSDPQIAVLSSPSAGYDVTALELYAAAVNMLPPAVMVGENAKGDWWRAIVSVLKHVSGPLGLALNPFVPGAGLIGATVSNMAGQIDTRKSVAKQVVAQEMQRKPRATKKK